jgi:hypothetical protein
MVDDTFIKASREPAKNSYGQNGSPQASSLLPGQTKPNIPNVSPPSASRVPGLDAADQLSARVHTTDGRPTGIQGHDGLPARSTDSGSPGGKIPAALAYRDTGKR